jgi:hypothetical protein
LQRIVQEKSAQIEFLQLTRRLYAVENDKLAEIATEIRNRLKKAIEQL